MDSRKIQHGCAYFKFTVRWQWSPPHLFVMLFFYHNMYAYEEDDVGLKCIVVIGNFSNCNFKYEFTFINTQLTENAVYLFIYLYIHLIIIIFLIIIVLTKFDYCFCWLPPQILQNMQRRHHSHLTKPHIYLCVSVSCLTRSHFKPYFAL